MKINNKLLFSWMLCILCFQILSSNICYAGPVSELSKIRCRDFLFIHKGVQRVLYADLTNPHFVYENSKVEIVFYKDFVTRVLERLIEESNDKRDKELMSKIESLDAYKYHFTDFNEIEKSRLKMTFAELLESGEFILKEKKTNAYIQDIRIGYYGMHVNNLGVNRGILFFLPSGEIFFQFII